MGRFRRRKICSGWSLEQYSEHRHSYILTAPRVSNLSAIKTVLLALPGSSHRIITNDVNEVVEIYFSCNLPFKETIIKVAGLLNLPYNPPKITKKWLMTPVKQYTLEGEYIRTWDGVNAAAKALGISAGNISSCVNGKVWQASGYIWKK